MTKNDDFKFDVVIGNPPYQEEIKGTSDRQIYPYFMDESYKIADIAEFITKAGFLFNAGKTPRKWNEKMLQDPHLKVLFYEPNSSKVFENTGFKGGVAVTYWDRNSEHAPIGTFSPFPTLQSIIGKVVFESDFTTISKNIFVQSKFDLDALYKENPDLKNMIGSGGKEKRLTTSIFKLPIFSKNETSDENIKIWGIKGSNTRTYRYIKESYLATDDLLNSYKVLVPASNGSGSLGETLSTPLIGEPLIGFTQTFIAIGKYDNLLEAENTLKYVKTKFARVMLGTLKVTQHNHASTWKNVPLQDFTANSDIDWTKSIAEIDQQLYQKYNLSQDDIDFIETHVKEMD